MGSCVYSSLVLAYYGIVMSIAVKDAMQTAVRAITVVITWET